MNPAGAPYKWAEEFDNLAKNALKARDHSALINYESEPSARLAVPTNEHYLPLLYAAGAAGGGKPSLLQ